MTADEIYHEYPRKVAPRAAKQAIERAIKRLVKGEYNNKPLSQEEASLGLFNRTLIFARSPAGNRGKFTPHPTTFYNQSRYLDDKKEWEDEDRTPRNLSPSEQRGFANESVLGDTLRKRIRARAGNHGGEQQDSPNPDSERRVVPPLRLPLPRGD